MLFVGVLELARTHTASERQSLDLNTSQSECCALSCCSAAASTRGLSCADYYLLSLGKPGSKVAST